jgi:hypothetical protein
MNNTEQMENSLRTIEIVPEQSPKPTEGLLPETVINLPNLSARDAMSMRSLIQNFCPTGWKVVVNLPFVPNPSRALFLIRCTPFSPPLQPQSREDWIAIRNNLSPILFDPLHTGFNDTANSYAEIPAGISITQYQEPNLLSLMTAAHRYWSGTINYHIRVVGDFIMNGYIYATKHRQLMIPTGRYNEYQYTPYIPKLDVSTNSAMQNSYIRSDLSMFRHMEITVPYERAIKTDMFEWSVNRVLAAVQSDLPAEYFTNEALDDFIGIYAESPLTSSGTGKQIEFIIETSAGPDFDLKQPLPLNSALFRPNSYLVGPNGKPTNAVYENYNIPFVRPDTTISSNGINAIAKVPTNVNPRFVKLHSAII